MSAPYYRDEQVTVHHGDCLAVMAELPDASVDAIVTDPPYDLTTGKRGGSGAASINLDSPYGRSRIGTGNGSGGFMGKAWDSTGIAFDPNTWQHCLRLIKPGGYLLAFGGTRTWHRLAAAIEDAGFEIRDSIAWLYGSGFPKSLDVSKAIDKAAGVEREVVATGAPVKRMIPGADQNRTGSWIKDNGREFVPTETAPATDAAKQWQGWGTALKPAFEPIVIARKPLRGTVAANVVERGTGALNIDACRVGTDTSRGDRYSGKPSDGRKSLEDGSDDWNRIKHKESWEVPAGRWPTNVVIDEHTAAGIDVQSGERPGGAFPGRQSTQPGGANGTMNGGWSGNVGPARSMSDTGGASRFFPTFRYEAKAPTSERPSAEGVAHPTVKPLDLMRWLVRLVTPAHGLVLDPFAGSGTTAEACIHEHMRCITIEREADYLPLIMARLSKPMAVGFDFEEPA